MLICHGELKAIKMAKPNLYAQTQKCIYNSSYAHMLGQAIIKMY